MSSHPSAADDAAFSLCAALAPKGAFYSHRGATPARDISAGTLSGVETVPAASPSHAAGTHYSVR